MSGASTMRNAVKRITHKERSGDSQHKKKVIQLVIEEEIYIIFLVCNYCILNIKLIFIINILLSSSL